MRYLLRYLPLVVLLSACDGGPQTARIVPNPVPKSSAGPPPVVDDATRFGYQTAAPQPVSGQSGLAWHTPQGWTPIPPQEFRDPNFRLEIVPDGEAYVTVLPGGGGGLFPNLNRWRRQFGLDPIDEDQIAALPRLMVLDRPAPVLDITGAFAGMGQTPVRDHWRLIGALVELPGVMITVKMTGPADALEAEVENFFHFCESLAIGGGAPAGAAQAALPEDHPPLDDGGAMTVAAAPDSDFDWTLPAGWRDGPPRDLRLATFLIGDGDRTEVSVIMLPGTAGGTVANIQRWYSQMENQPPSAEAIAELPSVRVLDQECPLVQVEGHFSGMGRDDVADAGLTGLICPLPGRTLFIKMTGPAGEVKEQRDSFVAFCLSLRER